MSEEEKKVLNFWKENNIFEKSVQNRKNGDKFVFFEGPPTANGKPGVHHVEARAFKDIILRYKTMSGFFVPRVAGWDTHGLPVEVEVEKELGLKTKKDILNYGVADFNKKCRESVWKYKELWESLTERMGFWIDTENAYVTYENSYIEKLWGIIKEFHKNKLLYEDYKVLPWCMRCGTALSSQEVAQGYQTITDKSVIVKFPISNSQFQIPNNKLTYLLVWTTTPWTLPGNVALAVNPKEIYIYAKVGEEVYILTKTKISVLENPEILKEVKGSDLVGLEYEPLFNISTLKNKNSHKVYEANFVTTNEGTGIVHIAPMYGEDDYKLGEKVGLPKYHTVDEEGKFSKDLKPFWLEGSRVKGQGSTETENKILEYLKAKRLLFAVQDYKHDYPFCWRCKTSLLYYARKAWWVDVNKIRKNLLKNNEQINWFPDYLKHGRFGEWLKEEKNWAFSRERFWGTPLPIWRCENCKKIEVMGSVDELQKKSISKNNFIFMRHGESNHNVNEITGPVHDTNLLVSRLTDRGKEQVRATAEKLKKKIKNLDIIISSSLVRAKETSEIVSFVFKGVEIILRDDLQDINPGIYEGKTQKEAHQYMEGKDNFLTRFPKGESREDVKKRIFRAVDNIDKIYERKNILIVSHGDPLWILSGARKHYPETGNVFDVLWQPSLLNEDGNLDLHKPYIDEIKIKCSCNGIMTRTPEVADVWFDSGSMPYASNVSGFPADYIVEAIDQTRGWFYTLLAVATLLGKKTPYKNVISMGHLLDPQGKKMSKSLGNIVDPMGLMEKYGADSVRWYFYTINQPWDSKLFKEEDVKDIQRRFFVILQNVVSFLKTYEKDNHESKTPNPKLVINQWVFVRLNEIIKNTTEKIDSYDIVGAARDLEYFVTEDLSRWYVRRIRNVMKTESSDKTETQNILKFILLEIAKLIASFIPFSAEKIYKELGGEKESVHLEDFPEANKKSNENIIKNMNWVRKIVSLGLEARAKASIKVRQPLGRLKIKYQNSKTQTKDTELLDLIKAEVNVKEIVFDDSMTNEIELDTTITPELKEEGVLRDLIREIQSARKKAGLTPKNKVSAEISISLDKKLVAEKFKEQIKKEANLKDIKILTTNTFNVSFTK